jgi:hypothetical protein
VVKVDIKFYNVKTRKPEYVAEAKTKKVFKTVKGRKRTFLTATSKTGNVMWRIT